MAESELQGYADRAKQLRSDGRFEEAILVARKATAEDPEDPNGWWQLALAHRDKDGGDSGLKALNKVLELAPDFVGGWQELGRTHQSAGRLDQAIEAFERALEVAPDSFASMRMLAWLLRDDEDATPRRLQLLRTVFEQDELRESSDLFDLGYLLLEAKEHAQAALVYEAYVGKEDSSAAYFNLALAYRSLGRQADAFDACEEARRKGDDSQKLMTFQQALRELLDARAALNSTRQLPQAQWFQHYLNPYALLDASPGEVDDNPKALQRAKQALLREIELEDGKVAWLPGLVIDKSTALARLAELDNPDTAFAHALVHDTTALHSFLTHGRLAHFLITDESTEDVYPRLMPHQLDERLLAVIGPKFAAQFNQMLTKALEDGDTDVLDTLLAGRRWVLPEHLDACFDGARRSLARMAEPLQQLVAQAETRTVGKQEIEGLLRKGQLLEMLELLPMELHQAHSSVGMALRELAVACYSRTQDAEAAKAVLALGRDCAKKSPALLHQYEQDEKTLDGFIAEEQAKEAHLSFRNREVSITRHGVTAGDRTLAPSDIVGIRWGLVVTSAQPRTIRHTIAFQARVGQDLDISWTVSAKLDEQKGYWDKLVEATLEYIFDPVSASFTARLERDGKVLVGPLEVHKTGVMLTSKGWFTDKQVLVPWERLKTSVVNGTLLLYDADKPKVAGGLTLETTYNAFLLHLRANKKEQGKS